MAKEHIVKCWPEWFADMKSGSKMFEVRLNDRDYQAGDTLVLLEFTGNDFTGEHIKLSIRHVWSGVPGLREGYVVLTFDDRVVCIDRRVDGTTLVDDARFAKLRAAAEDAIRSFVKDDRRAVTVMAFAYDAASQQFACASNLMRDQVGPTLRRMADVLEHHHATHSDLPLRAVN